MTRMRCKQWWPQHASASSIHPLEGQTWKLYVFIPFIILLAFVFRRKAVIDFVLVLSNKMTHLAFLVTSFELGTNNCWSRMQLKEEFRNVNVFLVLLFLVVEEDRIKLQTQKFSLCSMLGVCTPYWISRRPNVPRRNYRVHTTRLHVTSPAYTLMYSDLLESLSLVARHPIL